MRIARPLLAALALAALPGCTETSLSRPAETEVFFQNPPQAVDILLVVDNSCSMDDEQLRLSRGFSDFVEYFDLAGIDYHIGVTTTDMDRHAGLLMDRGGVRVIDKDTPDAGSVFEDNVRVGTAGATNEEGLNAATAALSEDLLEGDNAGFYREEALLSILFVSDEEDASFGPVGDWIEAMRALKRSRNRRDAFSVSSLVGVDPETLRPEGCSDPEDPTGGASAGHRYADAALQTGGVVASICEPEYGTIVNRMGLATSRLLERFLLRRAPREGTLEVSLFLPDAPEEPLIVPAEGVDGRYAWVLEEVEGESGPVHRLRFTDPRGLPPVGTRIVVRYEAA